MVRLFLAAAIFMSSSSAFASFYDMCTFEAEVLEVTSVDRLNGQVTTDDNEGHAAVIKILSAENRGGHTGCQGYSDYLHILKLADIGDAAISKGDIITLDYDAMNGLTPDGVWSRTSWKLVD